MTRPDLDGDAEITEASDQIMGRVIEARGQGEGGGRVFRVRIIEYGDSKNGRRYTESVMRASAGKYDGARAYDHHRSDGELRSSTINGLVGAYRNVEAEGDGIYADLHLLPSATHAAEALDATIAAQTAGLPPLIGVSHDVHAKYRSITAGRRRMQEATEITKVNSADLVADPAAGGRATRMVAGGIEDGTGTEPDNEKEGEVPTKEEILAAFKEATDEDLAAVGLSRAVEADEVEEIVQVVEAEVPVGELKSSFVAGLMIEKKVKAADLPVSFVEALTSQLPERITESDIDAAIGAAKALIAGIERTDLKPTVQVTQESQQKKTDALDAMFAGDFTKGYRSFKEAFVDVTGKQPRTWDADFNRDILRESIGSGAYESRSTESMDSTTWDKILGDSITRRMIADYGQPSLQTWRQIVSNITSINDFRAQRIDRLGGYGLLPAVNQGAPYQPLTSPGDEEITYSISKRGGTEDLTLEMIANDDLRAIANIPKRLGQAAAITLYRYVWDILPTNAAVTYDSVALFHADHANTDAVALSASAVSARRRAMREQAAYGNSVNILSLVPKFLVVPPELEELAWQICTSAVAMPSGAPVGAATDIPNIHQGMTPIVIDYFSDANDWFLIADPNMVPTIEVGFYQGRQEPELFTQSDPSVGSMFNNDTLTYKIRHIYNGAVLDHRGMQRGTQ